MAIIIFDLDGTVIDTSHRYRDLPCGKIDLDYWFRMSTEENVAKDRLLPLANVWRKYHADGHTIVVCTARSFFPHPDVPLADPGATYIKYLADNDLPYHALLHRAMVGEDHASYSDGDLKTKLLDDWAYGLGLKWNWRDDAIMFDDNLTVIQKMLADRLVCIDATQYNAKLERLAA